MEAEVRAGQVLMEGIDGRPLLVLDRQGKGRVAQLLSDQIWLWARGFEGGGPQAESGIFRAAGRPPAGRLLFLHL